MLLPLANFYNNQLNNQFLQENNLFFLYFSFCSYIFILLI